VDNPHLFNEILERVLKIRSDLLTNPQGFVEEYLRDGRGRGLILEVFPRHTEFALLVQFAIYPVKSLVKIVKVELLGPSPPPEKRTNGHLPA
jgi:hypothetical protein